MDIVNQITQVTEYAAAVIVALLALDNAVDAIAKMFGNKEIDTICGKFSLWLNNLYAKIKPTVSVPPSSSGTSATVTTTTGV